MNNSTVLQIFNSSSNEHKFSLIFDDQSCPSASCMRAQVGGSGGWGRESPAPGLPTPPWLANLLLNEDRITSTFHHTKHLINSFNPSGMQCLVRDSSQTTNLTNFINNFRNKKFYAHIKHLIPQTRAF